MSEHSKTRRELIEEIAALKQRIRELETDDAEYKQAEEDLGRQAGLITSLLDSIPAMIFFKDVNGVYLDCNHEFSTFVAKTREEIIGKTDYNLFDKEIADSFRDNDRKMLEMGKPRRNDEWVIYPDGRIVLLDTLKTPYTGPDG